MKRASRQPVGRCFALLAAAALTIAGCANHGQGAEGSHQSTQSGLEEEVQSHFDLVQSGDLLESGTRTTRFPLAPVEVDGVPFELWVPEAGQAEDVPLSEDLRIARNNKEFHRLHEESDFTVFALFDDGTPFGTKRIATQATPAVGVMDSSGEFQPIDSTTVKGMELLPEAAPVESLQPVAASTWGPIVVWVGAGAGGKQWSVLSWNRDTSVLVELASSSSLMLDFGGVNLVPDQKAPMVNGGYAYFEVAVPQKLFEIAKPGVRFHDLEVEEMRDEEMRGAAFRVPLTKLGDLTFVGPSGQIAPDPVYGDGLFWSSTPFSSEFDQDRDFAPQSGGHLGEEPSEEGPNWLQALSYPSVFRSATGDEPFQVDAPTFIVWGGEGLVAPLFGFAPAKDWIVTDLAASEEFLVASISSAQVLEGDKPARNTPSSWLVAWDLIEQDVVGVAPTTVVAPMVSISADLVVWGPADLANGEDDGEAPDGFAWRIGEEEVYELPGGAVRAGPFLGGKTIAVADSEDLLEVWRFLDWM